MKITDIKTFLLAPEARPPAPGRDAERVASRSTRNWLFVKIETDEGISGVGECSGWPRVIETAVKDYRSILLGEDPRDIDRLWHRMFTASQGHGMLGTVGGGALTGIEMALWDIKGKALNQPIWNLLGGRFRNKIRVYGHARTPARANQLMEQGYTAMKWGSMASPASIRSLPCAMQSVLKWTSWWTLMAPHG